MSDDLESARSEAKLIGHLLGLVSGRASGHGDIKIEDVDVQMSTIVYKRNGKIFHLVVYDMTNFEP